MSIEQRINTLLNKMPKLKKILKRVYQIIMYLISPKKEYEGAICRITPRDDHEYFFGYYGISPWDSTERYMLCLRVKDTTRSVTPQDPAEIILIDMEHNNSFEVIETTKTWNVQQGCMLQWLGPDYSERIIYNDFKQGRYCSVILNVKTKEEVIIDMPIYSVSNDGTSALTLDFSRLHRLRKGYGYYNLKEMSAKEKCPDTPCIWHIDIERNKIKPLLKYTDFANFETREDMIGAEHKVNHIMINPSGNRFMVLHRWFFGNQKFTRLLTANLDGSDLFNLSDDNMISHCCWKSDNEVLAYGRKKKEGNGYFIMKDRTKEYDHMWPELVSDGHPSYSPDRSRVVTDTYPDRARMASIYLITEKNKETLARVFTPFKYDNELRCDLHPRWNRTGNKISFDAAFNGKRQFYIIEV